MSDNNKKHIIKGSKLISEAEWKTAVANGTIDANLDYLVVDAKIDKEELSDDIKDKIESIPTIKEDIEDIENNKADITYVNTEIENLKNYILDKYSKGINYMGNVTFITDLDKLPNPQHGDMWNVLENDINYIWNGLRWDPTGTAGEINASNVYFKHEIDEKIDELNDSIDGKQDALTAGDYIKIENDVISADLTDHPLTQTVNTLVSNVADNTLEISKKLNKSDILEIDENGNIGLIKEELIPIDHIIDAVGSDVVEKDTYHDLPSGSLAEDKKVYIVKDTNTLYRFDATAGIYIPLNLKLGETDSTAFKGSEGKKNRDEITLLKNTKVNIDYTPADVDKILKVNNLGKLELVASPTDLVTDADLIAILDDYSTTDVNDTKYADKTSTENHIADSSIHITTADKTNWDGKVNTHQGTANVNKILKVDANGDLVLDNEQDISGKLDKTEANSTYTPLSTTNDIKDTLDDLDGKIAHLKTIDGVSIIGNTPNENIDLSHYAKTVDTDAKYATKTDLDITKDNLRDNYYTKTESYTKTEVNTAIANAVSSVYKYKGTVADFASLPTDPTVGDVWETTDDGKNYAWNGTAWDDLGGNVDLSNYTPLTDFNTHKDDTVKHITAEERTKWDNTKDNLDNNYYTSAQIDSLLGGIDSGVVSVDGLAGAVDLTTKYNTITNFNSHKNDTNVHITTAERVKWDKAVTDLADLDSNLSDNYYTKTEVDADLLLKQDTLTAGDHIDITNNTISVDASAITDKVMRFKGDIGTVELLNALTEKEYGDVYNVTLTSTKYIYNGTNWVIFTDISGKVDKEAGKSLVKDTKVTAYDSHIADEDIHVTALDKTNWDAKLDAGDLPTKLSDLTNDINVISETAIDAKISTAKSESITDSKTYIDNQIASLVDTSPDALNTLNELAAALGDDPNFSTTITNQLAQKVDKEDGKALVETTKVASYDSHIADTVKHITAAERTAWNNKVDQVVGKSLISDTEIARLATVTNYDDTAVKADIADNEADITVIEQTFAELEDVLENEVFAPVLVADALISADGNTYHSYEDIVDAATNATSASITTHVNNTDIHITAEERTNWNNKVNASDLTSIDLINEVVNSNSNINLVDLPGYTYTTSAIREYRVEDYPTLSDLPREVPLYCTYDMELDTAGLEPYGHICFRIDGVNNFYDVSDNKSFTLPATGTIEVFIIYSNLDTAPGTSSNIMITKYSGAKYQPYKVEENSVKDITSAFTTNNVVMGLTASIENNIVYLSLYFDRAPVGVHHFTFWVPEEYQPRSIANGVITETNNGAISGAVNIRDHKLTVNITGTDPFRYAMITYIRKDQN